MADPFDPLDDFQTEAYSAEGSTRDVYWMGEGPAVVVIPEMPGLTPQVADFARRTAANGMTAVVPSLFGTPGRPGTLPNTLATMTRACVSKEFVCLAKGQSSPITVWLRALAAHAHERCGGPGVGVVGMCFTGGFALAMMVDETVLVPVLSQPSLPLPLGRERRADLGISAAELLRVKQRVDDGVCVIGLRFSEDSAIHPDRFDRLRRELGEGFIGVELDSSAGNAGGFKKSAHSVLTDEYRDEPGHPAKDAHDLVMNHLTERLEVSGD
jgi:dienelactone hydrolase